MGEFYQLAKLKRSVKMEAKGLNYTTRGAHLKQAVMKWKKELFDASPLVHDGLPGAPRSAFWYVGLGVLWLDLKFHPQK